VLVCTVEAGNEYGREVFEKMKKEGFEVEIDDSRDSISKKVRNGQIS
jgi:threonyl-tRNA synthetase